MASSGSVNVKYPLPSLTVLGGLVLIAAALSIARVVFIPIALAILLSFILTPLVIALQRKGLSRPVAVILVTIGTMGAVSASVGIIGAQFGDLIKKLDSRKENIKAKIKQVYGDGNTVFHGVLEILEAVTDAINPGPPPDRSAKPVQPTEKPTATGLFFTATGALVSILGTVALTVALTVAMLMKREDLRNRLIRLAGHGQLTTTTRAIDDATRRISRYLTIQVLFNAGFGIMLGLGCAILGIPYPLLWAFLGAIVRFVPYVGTWLAGGFPLLVSIADSSGWTQPILFLVYLVILGVTLNNYLEPMLLSRNIGVSPVALITATAFWTWLWGPIGLVLSTPMTVCLSVLGRYVPSLRFFDVLIGTEPALDPQHGYYQRLLARDDAEAAELIEDYIEDHTLEETCDEMLIPMLVQAHEDRNRGELSSEDLRYIVETTGSLLNDQDIQPKAATTSEILNDPSSALILGFPSRKGTDELALQMLQHVLAPVACRIEHVSNDTSGEELIEMIEEKSPRLLVIAAVPPGGLAKARYLCKRLHHAYPRLPIVVGVWGMPAGFSKVAEKMEAAGATHVSSTLKESRQQVAPLLQMASQIAPECATATTGG